MARKVIAVHGFMYDPRDKGWTNPSRFFREIDALTDKTTVGFGWYSIPLGFEWKRPFRSVFQMIRAWVGAWFEGYIQPYRHAWARAKSEGRKLAAIIAAEAEPVDLVCHSLGARVALFALFALDGYNVRRVVFMNGAELVTNAVAAIKNLPHGHSVEILNIMVETDRVLRDLGSKFAGDGGGPCIGFSGLGTVEAPAYWNNVILDDAEFKRRALALRGWTISGNDPKSFWDHHFTYRNPENRALVRAWLEGDNLTDLRA